MCVDLALPHTSNGRCIIVSAGASLPPAYLNILSDRCLVFLNGLPCSLYFLQDGAVPLSAMAELMLPSNKLARRVSHGNWLWRKAFIAWCRHLLAVDYCAVSGLRGGASFCVGVHRVTVFSDPLRLMEL